MNTELSRFRQARQREQSSEVGDQPTDGLIPIHWLHTHAYCELQIYLEKVQGLEAPPTVEMLAGANKHAILDEEHEKRAKLDLTVNEASAKAQLEEVSLISRDIYVKGTALYGRIDEVVFEPARIVIIDDKPSAQPYFTNKVQVWGYCQAFQEAYEPNLPLFGALRQEDTGDIVWLEEFLKDHAMLVSVTIDRIRAILGGTESPQPAGNSRKCKPCRFKESCPAYAQGQGL
ncbi:Dna2/Cas4 domain-containing protein [Chloroflexota bacterium]